MTLASLLLTAALLSARPVAVPGPVCAAPDQMGLAGAADGLRIGEEAYFRPVCEGTSIGSDLLFAFNSAVLKPTAAPIIAGWAERLAREGGSWTIVGHTDWIGSDAYNLRLSVRRAEAVREALIRAGIPADRLRAEGRGESRPVADNRTDAGRAKNRRVEIASPGGTKAE